MKTIAEQIADLENTRAAKAARMTEVMNKSLEEGRSTDTAEAEEFDTLEKELQTIDADLVRLRKLEVLNAQKAAPAAGKGSTEAQASRAGVQVKHTEKLEPGIEFARYAMCVIAAKGDHERASRLAQTHYPHSERVNQVLQFQARGYNLVGVMKAAVHGGTTLDPTYAKPLVDYQNFAGDFLEYLRPRTIIGQFGTGGVPALNRIPFNVRIAGQTSGGSAGWVGEGAPKPLTKFDFNATELGWAKVAAIAVLTNELIRFSDPSAERLVREALAGAVMERIDRDFVDPAKAAVANVSPASITNGIAGIPSGGADADAIRDDLKALWTPFIAANNPPSAAVYIMNSTTAMSLSMMMNPLGQPEFGGVSMRGGSLGGVPVVVSDYVPTGVVILANANDIWLADDGQVTVDASQEASLEMDSAPTNNAGTGVGAAMVSMWQTNSTAFRAERYINWARRRASGVSYLTGVTWGTTGVTP